MDDDIKLLQGIGVEGFVIHCGEGYSLDADQTDHNGDGKPDMVVTRQIEVFDRMKVPYILYHSIEPGLDPVRQTNAAQLYFGRHAPKSVSLDCEIYVNYFVTPIRNATPAEMNFVYKTSFYTARASIKVPVFVYSGRWVMNGYCLDMISWMKSFWWWCAEYVNNWDDKHPEAWPKTLDQFKSQIAALVFIKDPKYPTIAMWQVAGDIKLPGMPHQLDFSIIDRNDIFNWMFKGGPMPILPGIIPVPPAVNPPAVPGEVWQVANNIKCLTVRTGPGSTYPAAPFAEWLYGVDLSLPGNQHQHADKVAIIEKSGNWGRFADHRWVNLGCMERVG